MIKSSTKAWRRCHWTDRSIGIFVFSVTVCSPATSQKDARPGTKRSIACTRATRPHAVFFAYPPEDSCTSFSISPSNHVYVAIVPHLTENVKAVCNTIGRALQMRFEGFPNSTGPVKLSNMHPVRNSLHTNGWQR